MYYKLTERMPIRYSFLLSKFPMGRLGEPRDAAKLVVFLASNESEWITGQIIHSDGGFW